MLPVQQISRVFMEYTAVKFDCWHLLTLFFFTQFSIKIETVNIKFCSHGDHYSTRHFDVKPLQKRYARDNVLKYSFISCILPLETRSAPNPNVFKSKVVNIFWGKCELAVINIFFLSF